jgi:hypothetical protein
MQQQQSIIFSSFPLATHLNVQLVYFYLSTPQAGGSTGMFHSFQLASGNLV